MSSPILPRFPQVSERKRRDSNPRTLAGLSLSRRVHSAALPRFRPARYRRRRPTGPTAPRCGGISADEGGRMRFDEGADLDTSHVDDLRGGGGGGGVGGRVALGGGGLGVVGLILYFLLSQLGGGGGFDGGGGSSLPGGLGAVQPGQQADTSAAASACKTGADANKELDCE